MNMSSPLALNETAQLISYLHLLSSHRVLLLESDESCAEMIQSALHAKPFVLTTAKSGPEALNRVMKQREFDLILCDMATRHSPGLAFYQAISRIRSHLCERFIFMKGHHGDPEVDAFVRKVNGLVLWKPFEGHVLLETIGLALRKQGKNLSSPMAGV